MGHWSFDSYLSLLKAWSHVCDIVSMCTSDFANIKSPPDRRQSISRNFVLEKGVSRGSYITFSSLNKDKDIKWYDLAQNVRLAKTAHASNHSTWERKTECQGQRRLHSTQLQMLLSGRVTILPHERITQPQTQKIVKNKGICIKKKKKGWRAT